MIALTYVFQKINGEEKVEFMMTGKKLRKRNKEIHNWCIENKNGKIRRATNIYVHSYEIHIQLQLCTYFFSTRLIVCNLNEFIFLVCVHACVCICV